MKFEIMGSENFYSPFTEEVQWANQGLLQVVKLKDIKIVGCEVLPYRLQIESSVENYEIIRQLFLSRKLNELTNIKWTKISITNPQDKFRMPKSSPLIISSSYEESEFDPLGETVVCHASHITGYFEDGERAEKIIGTESTTDLKACKVFVTRSDTHLYVHSNYKKPGYHYNTKIGTNTKVSLFTLFLNLTCLDYPDDEKIHLFATIHKNHVQYFIDEKLSGLDEKFFCGAMNLQFV